MTQIELEKSLIEMIEQDKVMHTIVIDGITCEEDKAPAYAFVDRLMGNHNNIDVIVPSHEKPHLISVKEIGEQIVENAYLKPYANDYKVYLIDADLVNTSGQNKLLKILEEPPAYAIFILFVKNISSLLDTVKSRAAIFSLSISNEVIEISDENKAFIIEGAKDFCQMSGLEIVSFTKSLVGLVKSQEVSYDAAFDIMKKLYRDAILISEESALKPMLAEGEKFSEKLAANGTKKLLEITSIIEETEKAVNNGNSPCSNPEIAICSMIYDIRA